MITFFVGNHGPAVHVQDTFEYVLQGLRNVGADIHYSLDYLTSDGINLLMENDVSSFSDEIILLKKRNPKTKIYLMVTEILGSDGIFNSANTLPEEWDQAQIYQNRSKWEYRSKQFHKLVPYVDGFVVGAEPLIPGYSNLGPKLKYLPLAPVPGHHPIDFLDYSKRDIDFIFTGTETPYRRKLLGALTAHGCRIASLNSHTPDYLRRHFFGRAKISLGIKLSERTQFMSKQRAHYHLINRIPHIFERTPDKNDLQEFVNFADPDADFVDTCRHFLNNFSQGRLGNFDEFAQSDKLNYLDIFENLKNFLCE
jgi:hypothetical protein